MKIFLLCLIAVLLSFVGLSLAKQDHKVVNGLDNVSWIPDVLKIKPGDTVTWEWFGNHNVAQVPDSKTQNFDPNACGAKKCFGYTPFNPNILTFTQQFDEEGTFTYVCEIHAQFGMYGTIIVDKKNAAGSFVPSFVLLLSALVAVFFRM